jgi:hypothetical protein
MKKKNKAKLRQQTESDDFDFLVFIYAGVKRVKPFSERSTSDSVAFNEPHEHNLNSPDG